MQSYEGNRSLLTRYSIFFLLLAIILGTFFRISLIVISPFVIVATCLYLKLRMTNSLLFLLLLITVSLLLSFFNGLFLKYKLLSLYNMLPFIVLLFADPKNRSDDQANVVSQLFKCLSLVAFINDIVGFVQLINNPDIDDSFFGIYSKFSVSLNGLVLFNAILFFYYFCLFLYDKKSRHIVYSLFFLGSSIMGFYGAGLIVVVIAFILVFFKPTLKAVIRTLSITVVSIFIIYYLLLYFKPNVLDYNLSNIKKIAKFDNQNGPRKVVSFYNYGISYPHDLKDFLFGSGPGTFNSRSAFIVGSPTFFDAATILKSEAKPYYFKNFAYTLWNSNNTSQLLYQDGFRNQPFSSLLTFLGEYGLIFTICFFMLFYDFYKKATVRSHGENERLISAYVRIFKFLSILLILLLCIDNFFEYPEIIVLILTSMKVLQIEISKLNFQHADKAPDIIKHSSHEKFQ